MPNSFYSPVITHDKSRNSFGSPLVQGVFNPFDPANNLKLWLSSRDTVYLKQNSAGTGAVTADGDPVGYLLDKSATAQTFVQTTAGRRPTYKPNVRNGNPVLRFGGQSDPRALLSGAAPLNTAQSCTIIATIGNREPGPPIGSYVASLFTFGSFPDAELDLYNAFVDPVNVKLNGSGTVYKNGATSPLTLANGEWFTVRLDIASGFTQSGLTLADNKNEVFAGAMDFMDEVILQPTPSEAIIAQWVAYLNGFAGL